MIAPIGDITPMTDSEFRMFGELLRNHCGLHFGPESRFLLEKRLARRMTEIEVESFAAYHYLLRSERDGGEELANAVDELTTNETYFFRELSPLRALVNEIVPEFRRGSRARSTSGARAARAARSRTRS